MKLQPNRFRYEKLSTNPFKKIKNSTSIFFALRFGRSGILSEENATLPMKQFITARRFLVRHFRKDMKIWFHVFPHFPRPQRPVGTRMGRGKSASDDYVVRVTVGQLLFEMNGPLGINISQYLRILGNRFSINTVVIKRPIT